MSEQPAQQRSRDGTHKKARRTANKHAGAARERFVLCQSREGSGEANEQAGAASDLAGRIVSPTQDLSAKIFPAGPGPHNRMLLGCTKSGAPRIRGPYSVEHVEHVHRRGCIKIRENYQMVFLICDFLCTCPRLFPNFH
jgi:hypothetical protein